MNLNSGLSSVVLPLCTCHLPNRIKKLTVNSMLRLAFSKYVNVFSFNVYDVICLIQNIIFPFEFNIQHETDSSTGYDVTAITPSPLVTHGSGGPV